MAKTFRFTDEGLIEEAPDTIGKRQEEKKNIKTPDNFNFGDMPADIRKRYKQMLENR